MEIPFNNCFFLYFLAGFCFNTLSEGIFKKNRNGKYSFNIRGFFQFVGIYSSGTKILLTTQISIKILFLRSIGFNPHFYKYEYPAIIFFTDQFSFMQPNCCAIFTDFFYQLSSIFWQKGRFVFKNRRLS